MEESKTSATTPICPRRRRHVVPTLNSAQHRRKRDQQNLSLQMFPLPFNPWIAQLGKILQAIVHKPLSPIHKPMLIACLVHLYAPHMVKFSFDKADSAFRLIINSIDKFGSLPFFIRARIELRAGRPVRSCLPPPFKSQ